MIFRVADSFFFFFFFFLRGRFSCPLYGKLKGAVRVKETHKGEDKARVLKMAVVLLLERST